MSPPDYPSATGDATEPFIRTGTELTMKAPSRWLAEATSRRSKTYLYNITWAFSTKGGQALGAFHGIDMVLLFQMRAAPWDKSADILAKTMRRYWIRFAETGDPNTAGLADWPAYDSTAASCLELGSRIRSVRGPHEEAFRLINRLYGTELNRLTP